MNEELPDEIKRYYDKVLLNLDTRDTIGINIIRGFMAWQESQKLTPKQPSDSGDL